MLCRAYYLVGVEPKQQNRPASRGDGNSADATTDAGTDSAATALHPDDVALARLRARFPVPFGRPERRYVCLHGSVEDVWTRAAELGEWLNKEGGGEKGKLMVVLGMVKEQRS